MMPPALRAALPDPDVVFRPARRDLDPETGEAAAQALWDRHTWFPHGSCWLWCGRDRVDVTWLGPVQSSGSHAAMWACLACLYELDQRVLLATMRKDGTAKDASQPPTYVGDPLNFRTAAGRHRR